MPPLGLSAWPPLVLVARSSRPGPACPGSGSIDPAPASSHPVLFRSRKSSRPSEPSGSEDCCTSPSRAAHVDVESAPALSGALCRSWSPCLAPLGASRILERLSPGGLGSRLLWQFPNLGYRQSAEGASAPVSFMLSQMLRPCDCPPRPEVNGESPAILHLIVESVGAAMAPALFSSPV